MNAVGESFNQGRLAVSSLHEIAFWDTATHKVGRRYICMAGRAPAATPPWRNFLIREQPVSSFLTNAAADNQHRMRVIRQYHMGACRRHGKIAPSLGHKPLAGLRRFMGQCFGFGLRRNAPAKCQRLNFARHIYSAARRTVVVYQEGASWLFPDLWEDLSPPYRRLNAAT